MSFSVKHRTKLRPKSKLNIENFNYDQICSVQDKMNIIYLSMAEDLIYYLLTKWNLRSETVNRSFFRIQFLNIISWKLIMDSDVFSRYFYFNFVTPFSILYESNKWNLIEFIGNIFPDSLWLFRLENFTQAPIILMNFIRGIFPFVSWFFPTQKFYIILKRFYKKI